MFRRQVVAVTLDVDLLNDNVQFVVHTSAINLQILQASCRYEQLLIRHRNWFTLVTVQVGNARARPRLLGRVLGAQYVDFIQLPVLQVTSITLDALRSGPA